MVLEHTAADLRRLRADLGKPDGMCPAASAAMAVLDLCETRAELSGGFDVVPTVSVDDVLAALREGMGV